MDLLLFHKFSHRKISGDVFCYDDRNNDQTIHLLFYFLQNSLLDEKHAFHIKVDIRSHGVLMTRKAQKAVGVKIQLLG